MADEPILHKFFTNQHTNTLENKHKATLAKSDDEAKEIVTKVEVHLKFIGLSW